MKWMLKNNDNEEIFDDFNKATVAFKNDICDHMRKNQSIYDIYNLPEDVCCHFAYKYDEGTISDDDLIAFCRAIMLMEAFVGRREKLYKTKESILKIVKNDINHHSEISEFDEEANISISLNDNEVKLDLEILKEKPTSLKTNAFIIDNKKKNYYFKSHQYVNTTTIREELGKEVDIDLSLRYVSEA